MMEVNTTPLLLDLDVVLNFYNTACELTGDTKRYKMDDEFFTAFMKEENKIISEGREGNTFTIAEA